MKRFLIVLVRLYQKYISPLKPSASCKFIPCCSEYAREALETHGALKGSLLAARRILSCNPLSLGGIDPVPPVLPRRRIVSEET